MRRSVRAVVAALGVVAVAVVPAAGAANQAVIAHSIAGYANPVVVMEQGDALDFTNLDPLLNHNVYEDGVPVTSARFSSATVGGGVTTPVNGVEALEQGTYGFYCTLHTWMKGQLQVVAEGTLPVDPPPLAPPESGSGPGAAVALPGGIVPTPSAVHPTADHLYVASYAQGAVVRLPFLEGGLLGAPETVASGFSSPLGVAVADDGTVFVADSHGGGDAYGGRTIGRVSAVTPTGPEVVVDGLPNGRHNTNNLAIQGGRLYITNGNSTDDGYTGDPPELPLSGTLLSVPLDARGIVVGPDGVAPAGLEVEAVGMRNLYDVAFRPGTSEAWITTNGPDTFDPWGEDTLVRVDVAGGPADFGFPECLYGRTATGMTAIDNPTPGAAPCGAHTPPEQLLGLHVSADGLAFGPAGGPWDGDLFIAEFGNFFGNEVVGHRVVRVGVNPDGTSTPPEDFALGPAPLDLAFGPAGLYVADFGTGQITLYTAP